MKRVQGQCLFTLTSAGTSKPVVKDWLVKEIKLLLLNMKEGETFWIPNRFTEGENPTTPEG